MKTIPTKDISLTVKETATADLSIHCSCCPVSRFPQEMLSGTAHGRATQITEVPGL